MLRPSNAARSTRLRIPGDHSRVILHVLEERLQLRQVVEHVGRDVIEHAFLEPAHDHEELDVGHADLFTGRERPDDRIVMEQLVVGMTN